MGFVSPWFADAKTPNKERVKLKTMKHMCSIMNLLTTGLKHLQLQIEVVYMLQAEITSFSYSSSIVNTLMSCV